MLMKTSIILGVIMTMPPLIRHDSIYPFRGYPVRKHKEATTLPEKVMAFYLSSHFGPSWPEVSLDMELWTHRALSVIVMQVQ